MRIAQYHICPYNADAPWHAFHGDLWEDLYQVLWRMIWSEAETESRAIIAELLQDQI